MNPRTRIFLISMAIVAGMGAMFGATIGAAAFKPQLLTGVLMGSIAGAVDFVTMATLIGGAENFLPRMRLGKTLERAPFLAVFGIKAVLYSAVILAVVGGRLGPSVAALFVEPEIARMTAENLDAKLPLGVLVPTAFLMTFFFLLLQQLRMLVGASTLRDIVLGRYHRARVEERFFLFVDIVGSTPLAERLGPVAANRFLNRVFQLASDPVDDHHGEVYQYVGDEVVITWKVAQGRVAARPLACYFAIERALNDAEEEFAQEFGARPRLRAALHAGSVITGEVGGSRRAIVFHGDVMNTTSRLENATRDLGRPFLVSEDAMSRMDGKEAYRSIDLGPQPMRGRVAPLRVYAVEPVTA
ncbi:MAG: adenylate/guanylate cyclase domain-containing protein [Proteobacteria bacterium]|nr:adenylate/guanylate cyclase domain-containing protein [Pseudomonadota bacterium]